MNKEKVFIGPVKYLVLFVFMFGFICPSYAQDSDNYNDSDSIRPPSAFSICCCEKENDDGSQTVYSCKHVEDEKCPDNTRQYKNFLGDCPSNLMVTKYRPEQNQESKDN